MGSVFILRMSHIHIYTVNLVTLSFPSVSAQRQAQINQRTENILYFYEELSEKRKYFMTD